MGAEEASRKRSRSKSAEGASKPEDTIEAPAKLELAPDEFMVSIAMPEGTKLGLDVDWKDGRTLYVKKVLDGIVAEYNKHCTADKPQVLGGDRIIAINGQFDDPKVMLAECKKKDRKLQMLIRTTRDLTANLVKEKAPKEAPSKAPRLAPVPKPTEFIATIDMAAHTALGIEVDWGDGRTLYVKSVLTGAIEQWNNNHSSEYVILPGARVLSVNGFGEHSETMVSLCRELVSAQGLLQLRMLGPPLPPIVPPKVPQQPQPQDIEKAEEKKDKDKDKGKEKGKEKDKEKKEKDKDKDKEKEKDKDKDRKKDKEKKDK